MIEDWVLQAENEKRFKAVIKNYVENIYYMGSLTTNSVLNKMIEDIGEFNKIDFDEIANVLSSKEL